MLYFFMLLLLIIPIMMIITVIRQFKNHKKVDKTYEKMVEKKYIYARCRNSVREEKRRVKSISEYYRKENDIVFP